MFHSNPFDRPVYVRLPAPTAKQLTRETHDLSIMDTIDREVFISFLTLDLELNSHCAITVTLH